MAYAMRNTTAQLAELLPDITIRTRAEVEAEEAAAEAEEDNHSEDEKPVKSSRKARAKYALRRHKLLRKPLGDEEQGLVRTKKGMSKFKEWDDKAYDVVRFKEPEPDPDPEAEDALVDEEDAEEDQFLAEYDIPSGTMHGLTTLDEESIR